LEKPLYKYIALITPAGVYQCINFSALPERFYLVLPGFGRHRVRSENHIFLSTIISQVCIDMTHTPLKAGLPLTISVK